MQILDTMLIVNEVIDYLIKKSENEVLCKLDIKKAYDHINWNFSLIVMRKCGLGRSGQAG